MTPQEVFKAHGFPYPENLIMAFIGGSTQHGAKLGDEFACHDERHDTPCIHPTAGRCEACIIDGCDPAKTFRISGGSDTDWYGIFIPPKEKVLGIDSFEHFVFPGDTTKRERGNRQPDEVDIALHSLQKWAGMAAKGNPTVLSFLFANAVWPSGVWHSTNPIWPWYQITLQKNLFLAKTHLFPFLYYAKDQMERLMGLRGQKNVHRDNLVDLYGYDTKYAMHIIRLLSEAKELMEKGTITYPRPEVDLLKDIRRGKYKLTEIHEMGSQLQSEATAAQEHSSLPDKVDRQKVSELIANVHLEFYQ
jgi:predicted nucleotidyltransferase